MGRIKLGSRLVGRKKKTWIAPQGGRPFVGAHVVNDTVASGWIIDKQIAYFLYLRIFKVVHAPLVLAFPFNGSTFYSFDWGKIFSY